MNQSTEDGNEDEDGYEATRWGVAVSWKKGGERRNDKRDEEQDTLLLRVRVISC